MTHVFKIGDGTVEQSLIDQDPVILVDYDVRALGTDGVVVESCEVLIRSASGTAAGSVDEVLGASRRIQRLLEQGRRRQEDRTVARVYVTMQLDGDSDSWRSEILGGSLEPVDGPVMWRGAKAARYVLTWQRRDYWEGDERELPLFNPGTIGARSGGTLGLLLGGGAGTGGLQIVNDPTLALWAGISPVSTVIVPGEAVTGSMPAGVRVEIENDYNDSAKVARIYLGLYPLTLDESVALAETGTPSTSTWAATGWQSLIANYALTASDLAALGGQRYMMLVHTDTADDHSDTAIRWRVGLSTTEIYAQSETYQLTTDRVHEAGVLRLPPFDLPGDNNAHQLALIVDGRITTTGATGYFESDYVMFLPADYVRVLEPGGASGVGLAYTGFLTDDGPEDRLTLLTPTTTELGHWVGRGERVMLTPGQDYGLTLLLVDDAGDAVTARTATVRVWYRPRRLSIES